MSKFYVVATPIGNMEDMTFRAILTLKEVSLILCEDTRVTKKLLSKYEIGTKVMSYHEHSTLSKIEDIIKILEDGKDIAMVSDAGTPAISDPGSFLVTKIREHFKDEVQIVPIPGASALTTILSVSGMPSTDFTFLGFLPHKKGRQTLFREIADSERTYVFYESPHRILKSLEALVGLAPKRKVFIGREMTKMFEEFISGTAQEALDFIKTDLNHERGEFAVVVFP